MKTAALIAFPLLCGLAYAMAVIRTFGSTLPPAETAPTERQARIEAALAAEGHDGRRMALRLAGSQAPEEKK